MKICPYEVMPITCFISSAICCFILPVVIDYKIDIAWLGNNIKCRSKFFNLKGMQKIELYKPA